MSGFPAIFQLSSLNGTNGFRISGSVVGDQAGRAVSSAGDVNGDGFDDLIIGARYADNVYAGPDSGAAYVVFGKAGGFAANLNLSALNGTNGFKLTGNDIGDWAGFAVSSAGDVNGDGYDDIIVGAPRVNGAGSNVGASYVVFGKAGGFAANFDLSALNGSDGFLIQGATTFNENGSSVSGAGDVNGDGFDDIIVGARYNSLNGSNSGASYVVFGKAAGFSASLSLLSLDGSNGFAIVGANTDDFAGQSVSSAGDVNGDGFDDLIIGATGADPNGSRSGASYVVFGKAAGYSAIVDLGTLNGANGFRIEGVVLNDQSGKSVSAAGDVNGDGIADLVIGAHLADSGEADSGAAYVVFGKAAGFAANLKLSSLNGFNGFRINGVAASDLSGLSVASAGDVNGDGFGDVIIGAPFANSNGDNSGASFVVFGKAGGFAPSLDLSTLDGSNGFRIDGVAALDYSGWSVSGAGDVNGDGFDDLIVGASNADPNGEASGASYVIFGMRAQSSVNIFGTIQGLTHNGGIGDDTVDARDGNDTLRGWEGDDTLLGGAGADTLDGGADNDTISGGSDNDIIIGSLGEDAINGGSGSDTLDFSAFAANRQVNVNLATRLVILHNGDEQALTSIENATGSKGADTITGNAKANVLSGGNGNDIIAAGAGTDTITGGSGRDILTGGADSDRFAYTTVAQSAPGGTARDDITDFTVDPAAGAAFIDRIDVKLIDAKAGQTGNQAFIFIGQAAFTEEGQIRATQSGADTLVEFNTTGANGAEMEILLRNFTASNLTPADFIL